HSPAMSAVHAQIGWLREHHALRPDTVFLENVDPRQAVAVFFLHRSHNPQRVVAVESKILDHLARVNHAGHAPALIAGAASVDKTIFHLALVRIPGPFLGIANTDGVSVRVHHDHVFAGADASKYVAHGINADFVKAHAFHLLLDALNNGTFVRTLAGNG